VLPVFFENKPVGQIEESGQGLSFTYSPEWLADKNNFAISLSMPLTANTYPTETATPWFANLLPEDQQLVQIGRLLGRSQADVYGLLERIGRETAGALSIGGPEPIDTADYRELDDNELSDIIGKLPQRPLLAGEDEVTMSLAGAQPKLAVAQFDGKIWLPLNGAASTHILKPASERLYATVENELLCMTLANKLKLPVAQTSMGVAGTRKYLLVERYDRKIIGPKRVRRHHQEDFCQALGYYPTEKYEARRGPGFKNLFGTLDKHARRSARDRLNLLDIIILAVGIGDTDRHGKNFSLILTDGGPRLAPGYDLLSSILYEGITRNMAMKIAEKSRAEYLERRHWERFAREVKLSPAATVSRVGELAAAIGDEVTRVSNELVDQFPTDSIALTHFAKKIREQALRIADNSKKGAAAEAND
jgi:serine/threonine-protein kinase HipA